MSGFPINLDLSEYFDDLRKYSTVFVNSLKFKDVGDVENHIKSVIGLEDNICLVHKKFLLPKNEDIQILKQYDIFKVQKCNFYDLQIHKTKKINTNLTCDQNALNLTQSEKTIDLSCRPRQRVKANVCQSPGTSGTLALRVDSKTCINSQILSSARIISLNGDQNISREKQKHKKKRHLHSDESNDGAGTDENILDMSVKNSMRKKHSNCFSMDDGSNLSESANDSNLVDDTKGVLKKIKKRKKRHEGLDDDSVDTPLEGLFCDKISVKDSKGKKVSKKAREDCINGNSSTVTNKVSIKNELENPVDFYSNNSVQYECSTRKKHKHSKKYSESRGPQDSQENKMLSLFSSYCARFKKGDLSENTGDSLYENYDSSKHSQEELNQNSPEVLNHKSDKFSQTVKDEESPVINNARSDEKEINAATNIKEEICSELDHPTSKRKRKRKPNKKKKQEKLMQMFAVGPVLNQLVSQTATAKSPSSKPAMHVFFSEEDFAEDMKIPPTPSMKCQTTQDSLQPTTECYPETTLSQEQSSSSPVTWQEQLLKLASTSSKPVVFHRNTNVATTSGLVSSSQPTQGHPQPVLNANHSNCNSSDTQCREVNPLAEDFQKYNGEVKSENNNEDKSSCTGTVNGYSSKKGLPDICKPLPIPNDLQNINLTDYPIIDKVVAEDLILFKVLKLNENGEPGISKPILARINGSSDFPDKISLQIIEGCEECGQCAQAGGSEDPFVIELRWADIKEPRLFYP